MIKVDTTKCKGCGVCEALCPEVFKLDANGISQVIGETCACSLDDVVAACPENAISQE
ncbi:MAG TPA: ferredoxin [bacterium]|nr:ferredoxin [bacterium]